MTRKSLMTIAFLISFIPSIFGQTDGESRETVELALLQEDGVHYDVYSVTLPEDPEELKLFAKEMVKAFENTANLYTTDHVGNRDKIDTILQDVTAVGNNADSIGKTTKDLTDQVAQLLKNQAKFLSVGVDGFYGSTFWSPNRVIGIKPEVRMNFFNTFLVGVGVGGQLSGNDITLLLDVSLGFWVF